MTAENIATIVNRFAWLLPLLIFVAVWTLIWKGFALWRAARNYDPYWFAALLLINTLGILEILYLFIFSKYESKYKP